MSLTLTRNLEVLTNKAKAMNDVNKAILATVAPLQALFTGKGMEIYKTNGDFTKSFNVEFKEVLTKHTGKLRRVTVDNSHNSVSIEFNQIYMRSQDTHGYASNSFYKDTIFIICKGQDTNTEHAKYNVQTPTDMDSRRKRVTAKTLLAQTNKAYKLEAQINDLRSQLSLTIYDLQDK